MMRLESSFRQSLDAILDRVNVRAESSLVRRKIGRRFAVAFSGGADSTALFFLALEYARQNDYRLYVCHVHHGLSRYADDWVNHCLKVAAANKVSFEAVRVSLATKSGKGVEAEARAKRYEALGRICRDNDIPLILTAHHMNDQVETMLMKLFRGTGMAGLTGIAEFHPEPPMLGGGVAIGRPMLSVSRQEIDAWLKENGHSFIVDDSNTDERFMRNAVRAQLMPMISELFPGFEERLYNTSRLAASTRQIVDELAAADFANCRVNELSFAVSPALSLSESRRENLLRYWLALNEIRIPSADWFREAKRQIFDSKDDSAIELVMDDRIIRKYRGTVFAEDAGSLTKGVAPQEIIWNGEAEIALTAGGTICFDKADSGIDSGWLTGRTLVVRPYQGSAVLKTANRPTKTLKQIYQETGVPYWDREKYPVVYAGTDIVFAPGAGVPEKFEKTGAGCIRLRWQPGTDASGKSGDKEQ